MMRPKYTDVGEMRPPPSAISFQTVNKTINCCEILIAYRRDHEVDRRQVAYFVLTY